MKAMLEANEKNPLKRFINVTYDKSEEVYEIPNYCKNEFVCYDYPEMHCKNKLFPGHNLTYPLILEKSSKKKARTCLPNAVSLTRRFNGTLGSSNER